MLSIKKTFLALLTASVLYESSAAIANPTKNDDRGRVLVARRSTGPKANQTAADFLNRRGSLATRWFRPTQTFFTQKGSVAARSMRTKTNQTASDFFNRRGSVAAHWFRPTQAFFTQKGSVAARSTGTKVNHNVSKPTQTFFTQKGSVAARSTGTKANQNVFKPTQTLFTQKGPAAARSVGKKVNQNVFRPTQQGLNQKIRIQTVDIPQEIRTALAAHGEPMTKAHYSASRAEIAEVLQMLQQAEVHGALSRGTTQTLRNTLKNKYGITL